MKITYRAMTEADIASVIPLYMEYYNAQGDERTPETVRRRIWQELGSVDSYCLMAESNGEPIGFAMGRFQQYFDLMAYDLVEIVIAAQYQNRGIGTAFMQELERRVKEQGAAMVQLEAVNDELHAHFYGKLNYYDATNLVLKAKFLGENT